MELSGSTQPSTLRDYLQIVRRGWWTVVAVVALTTLSAALFSARQEWLYQASAELFVRPGIDAFQAPERALQTQADVATASTEVARRVRDALGTGTTPDITVTPKTDSNILVFTSTAASPGLAARAATEYAAQYRDFQRELVTDDIREALNDVEAEIAEVRARTRRRLDPTLYASLLQRREELRSLEVLETSKAFLVKPATTGVQVQPKNVRNVLLGFGFGLVLGLGLVFLREALDTRVRSTDEIAETLGIPLLARVPGPPKRLRRANRLVMINDPESSGADAFRILRANIEIARSETGAKTILVTSAGEREGKSTTAANLAVALARGGQRVVLVDLDLRRPALHRFFDLGGPGIAQVALGRTTLEDALAPIPLVWPGSHTLPTPEGNGVRPVGGLLHVLPVGSMRENVDDVLTDRVLANVLEDLRKNADVVLIDSTPLGVGDAVAVTAAVDALLVVTRVDVVRPLLRELARILRAVPVPKLGFVATGVPPSASYGLYAASYARSKPRAEEPVA